MAYQVVVDNFYTQQVTGTFGIPLPPNNYGIRYDPVTGDYQLRQFGTSGGITLGGYDALGGATLYQNGSWTGDAIQDSLLFTNNDPEQPTALAESLSIQIRQQTQQAHVAIGGNAGGHVLHPTAQPSQHTAAAGVNNSFPGTNPGIATLIPGGNILSTPPGQTPPSTAPTSPPAPASAPSSGSVTYGTNGTLSYPSDIFQNSQDILAIRQKIVTPLNVEEIFSDPSAALLGELSLFGGRELTTAGTVFLPMPNNAADSNATAWGADSMNNLTAALISKVSSDVGTGVINPTSVTTAVTTLLKNITGVDLGQAGQILNLLEDTGTNVLSDPNLRRQLNTILTSALLKQGGFDVPAEQILARSGVVPNSNLELLFNNVTLREFTFSYRLSPRSSPEAEEVRQIIHFFKRGMAAKKSTGGNSGNAGTFLASPNVFELEYITSDGQQIEGVNKFKTCALTNFAVNYSPDGQWSAYEEGQPVSYNIGMSFSELMPIYEDDYGNDTTKVMY